MLTFHNDSAHRYFSFSKHWNENA